MTKQTRLEPGPRVVIVGGGFGGLSAARVLAKAPVQVTLIDRHNYHLFRPMLYQAATGLLSADEIAVPLRAILRRSKNIDVLLADVTGVDVAHKCVRAGDGSIPYDYLVLATGAEYNYFGHTDWQQVAPSLTSVWDAGRIRGRILRAFEEAERAARDGVEQTSLQEWLTFVLVGGGPTGVELAGAIAELARQSLAGNFRHIDPAASRIVLIEAAPRLLSEFPESLASAARRRLERLGVEVRTGAAAQHIDETGVIVAGERIPSQTVLWAAGVRAPPAGRWLSAPADPAGRVIVNPDFSVPGCPDVYVIGDTARVVAPARNLVGRKIRQPELLPGMAQPAMQAGRYVALHITRRVRGALPLRAFRYWDKGNLAIVGRTFAIADLKGLRFAGFPGWLLWIGVHIYYLIGFGNRALVLARWAGAILLNRRCVRIFPPPDRSAQSRPGAQTVAQREGDRRADAEFQEVTH